MKNNIAKNTPIRQTDDRPINVIYETTEYDKFKFLNFNRNVKTIDKLRKKIMRTKGIKIPVNVNQNFEIIDGQHRVVIAKELRIPIPYFISQSNNNEDDIISINSAGKNWKPYDYLEAYSSKGLEDYILMKELTKKTTFLKLIYLISFNENKQLYKGSSEQALDIFKDGRFKFTDENRKLIINFVNYGVELEKKTRGLKWNSVFTSVLYYLWCNPRIEKERLMQGFIKSIKNNKGETSAAHVYGDIMASYNSLNPKGKIKYALLPYKKGYRFEFLK